MQEELKSLKQYCKEAKKRLKNGFWQNYRKNLDDELDRAQKAGVAASKVKEYYSTLSYEEKQRYTLELSNKYLIAVERYRKEKAICMI